MTLATTTHLNFRGQARAALDFYTEVFAGEQVVMTYGAMGQAERANSPEDVVWGQVQSEDGFRIMAFDVPAGGDYHPGKSAFYVSLRGDRGDEVRTRWDRLSDGATVLHPFGPSAWSPAYGMLMDRFGVTWVVDVAPSGSSD